MTVVDLDTRRQFTIGGSEAAAACGVDPFRSRVMLWAEKTGRYERDTSEAMRWGTLLEPVIFAELERQGFDVMPAPLEDVGAGNERSSAGSNTDAPGDSYLRSPAAPAWLVGHVDGFVDVDGLRGVLEVETAGQWSGHDWHSDAGAPLAYIVQCHHYMELTGLQVALLACLVAGQRLELRVVRRDQNALDRILELEDDFLRHVRSDTPPSPDGSANAHEAIRAMFPEANGRTIRLDRATWEACKELKARKEQLDTIKRQVAELQQTVELAMGDAEHAVSPFDTPVARWPTVNSTRLDTTALKAARPDMYQEFAVSKPTRRFTVE